MSEGRVSLHPLPMGLLVGAAVCVGWAAFAGPAAAADYTTLTTYSGATSEASGAAMNDGRP